MPPTALARCGIAGATRPMSVHEAMKAAHAYTHAACTATRRREGGTYTRSSLVAHWKPCSSCAMHAFSHGLAVKPKMTYHAWNSHIAASEYSPPRAWLRAQVMPHKKEKRKSGSDRHHDEEARRGAQFGDDGPHEPHGCERVCVGRGAEEFVARGVRRERGAVEELQRHAHSRWLDQLQPEQGPLLQYAATTVRWSSDKALTALRPTQSVLRTLYNCPARQFEALAARQIYYSGASPAARSPLASSSRSRLLMERRVLGC
eukprot:scaffold38576_cov64-Phaeocystis_antarctica.AAC.3